MLSKQKLMVMRLDTTLEHPDGTVHNYGIYADEEDDNDKDDE